MKMVFVKKHAICVALIFSFSMQAFTQSNQTDDAINEDSYKVVSAKRAIIKLLFSNIFRGESKETISLATKNIPSKLQNEFPKFPNLTTKIVSSDLNQDTNCAFIFHNFAINKNKATVSFGNCNDGLGYNFEKIKGKWQFASLENEND